MTFSISIPDDSFQTLLGSSNQTVIDNLDEIKEKLEFLYETQEGSFSDQEILEDCEKIATIKESILNEDDLLEQARIILCEYKTIIEDLIEKYRKFLSDEMIQNIEYVKNKRVNTASILSILFEIKTACLERDIQKVLKEMNQISVNLETYIQYLDQGILSLMEKTALDFFAYAKSSPNVEVENSAEEANFLKDILLILKQISGSILYELFLIKYAQKDTVNNQDMTFQEAAHFLKVPIYVNQLSETEFEDLLNETQGIWTQGDGLEYQQKLREEWS